VTADFGSCRNTEEKNKGVKEDQKAETVQNTCGSRQKDPGELIKTAGVKKLFGHAERSNRKKRATGTHHLVINRKGQNEAQKQKGGQNQNNRGAPWEKNSPKGKKDTPKKTALGAARGKKGQTATANQVHSLKEKTESRLGSDLPK